jgi:hypothetical protein
MLGHIEVDQTSGSDLECEEYIKEAVPPRRQRSPIKGTVADLWLGLKQRVVHPGSRFVTVNVLWDEIGKAWRSPRQRLPRGPAFGDSHRMRQLPCWGLLNLLLTCVYFNVSPRGDARVVTSTEKRGDQCGASKNPMS